MARALFACCWVLVIGVAPAGAVVMVDAGLVAPVAAARPVVAPAPKPATVPVNIGELVALCVGLAIVGAAAAGGRYPRPVAA